MALSQERARHGRDGAGWFILVRRHLLDGAEVWAQTGLFRATVEEGLGHQISAEMAMGGGGAGVVDTRVGDGIGRQSRRQARYGASAILIGVNKWCSVFLE